MQSDSKDGTGQKIDGQSSQPCRLDERVANETGAVVEALLTHAAEVRGPNGKLTRRVADRAEAIARDMALDTVQQAAIRKAAILRDVGKVGLPDQILKKSGPLTAGEYAEVRARMLPEDDAEDSDMVRAAIIIAYHHHERVDGTGYPERLPLEYIPLGSRILAVAEAYETMLVEAPWRKARRPAEALQEVQAGAGSQFDGQVVDALARTVIQTGAGPAAGADQ